MTASIKEATICSSFLQGPRANRVRASDSPPGEYRAALPRQRGASMIVVLLVLALAVGAFLVTVRLAPVYMEAWTVRAVINGLSQDHALRGADAREITRSLDRRFTINDVRSVRARDIEIQAVPGGMEVVAEYEVRVPLLGNIDGVVQFRHETVISE